MRMRPLASQDANFVRAIHLFLKQSFFPKTQKVIPANHRETSILYICRNIVRKRNQDALTIFEDSILEPAIQKHKGITRNLEHYEYIDRRGFFTTFLREIQEVGIAVRFTSKRGNIEGEINKILQQIHDFIDAFDSTEVIPYSGWYYLGPVSKYGFILVANPLKTQLDPTPYANRVKEKLSKGATRIYVFGTRRERHFVNLVIDKIKRDIPEITLVEKFKTKLDYRGEPNGLVGLFVKR